MQETASKIIIGQQICNQAAIFLVGYCVGVSGIGKAKKL
jgi:hypothetical protein